jgi:hypothetical protein
VVGNIFFGFFVAALAGGSLFEFRWRKACLVHEVLHLALEAGAPVEEHHDIITEHWFWLRNMVCGCNVVMTAAIYTSFVNDMWLIIGKAVLTFSFGMTITRVWVGTKCDRRPTRKKIRDRVKEWVKAHRPHLVPVRRPVPSPI